MMARFLPSRAKSSGISMIEILVTLLLVTLGLVGMASVQYQIQTNTYESYQRAQAQLLLQDMVDRITANRYSAPCYAFTLAGGSPYLGTSTGGGYWGAPTCSGFGSSETQSTAVTDLTEWDNLLKGFNEVDSASNNTGGIMDARGCIELDSTTSPETLIVTVVWQGNNETITPANDCANTLYGTSARRRSVSTTIQLANLI